MKKYLLLLAFVSPVWADLVPDIVKQGDQSTIEQVVADTFTFEEFAEWTAIRQKFEAKANKEKEKQLACVAKGKHAKTCIDPHWCLYLDNEKKAECVKYNVKRGLF